MRIFEEGAQADDHVGEGPSRKVQLARSRESQCSDSIHSNGVRSAPTNLLLVQWVRAYNPNQVARFNLISIWLRLGHPSVAGSGSEPGASGRLRSASQGSS